MTTEAPKTRPPARATSPFFRAVLFVLLAIAIAGAATLRVVWAGEAEIAKSTRALEKGDPDGAIVHARAAALWYAPGAPHVRVAYGRLLALAREAERRKLWETSLFAYRAIVTASESTKWLITPHARDADEAVRAIARIEARTGSRPPGLDTEPTEAIEASQLTALAEDQGPKRIMSAVLAASFLALIGGLAAFLRIGLDETGRVRLAGAVASGIVALAGVIGYCAALLLA